MHPRPRLPELDFTSEQSCKIVHIAETQGWQIAAHDTMRAFNSVAYRMAIDEYRGQLRFLLPLTSNDRVLQLRCGWGPIAINLASCSGSVVALDDRVSRIRFVSARRMQMHLQTVHTLGANISKSLPFASDVFDAVIMLDAFKRECASDGVKRVDTREEILNEIARVLKAGGWLLLGAANRLGLGRRKADQAERICSCWGYRRLLRAAGFASPQFYAPLPSHLEPFFIVPLDHPDVLDHFVGRLLISPEYQSKLNERGLSLVFRLASTMWRVGRHLRLTGLAQYAVPSYLIVAQKGEP